MPSEDLIDFAVIETQKENIQALPSGRSAKALATVFSPLSARVSASPQVSALSKQTLDLNASIRQEYEKELLLVDESDDPLDIYDRYVKWTLNAYPSAQATQQSQLLPLLERATKAFLGSAHYKNDPRYLRIWLHFIRFFSDSPRENFVYLSRHGIGSALALYYEEFAAWLEGADRWSQAEEIYKMGIESGARPVDRLQRKYKEFTQRKETQTIDPNEPSSPALPTVRPALAAKIDPFSVASPAQPQQPPAMSTAKKPKLAIFADDGAEARPGSGGSAKGWETIGTIADRKKENTIAPKPWAGETLKSSAPKQQGVPKMSIFKDQSLRKTNDHKRSSHRGDPKHPTAVNPKTGRLERVVVDLERLYPTIDGRRRERSFEQLLFEDRGFLSTAWHLLPEVALSATRPSSEFAIEAVHPPRIDNQAARSPFAAPATLAARPSSDDARNASFPRDDVTKSQQRQPQSTTITAISPVVTKRTWINDENDENSGQRETASRETVAKRMRREEKANRTHKIKIREVKQQDQTIQTNLDSPRGPKLKKKRKSHEQTMTVVTKAATDDIYAIFNQPLQSDADESEATEGSDEEEEEEEEAEEDDYTSGNESTGRLSANVSDFGDDTRRDLGLSEAARSNELEDETIPDVLPTDDTAWTEFALLDKHPDLLSSIASSDPTVTTTASVAAVEPRHELAHHVVAIAEEDTDEEMSEAGPQTKTTFVPVQPEDYEPPSRFNPYRDPNSRLPFMTPIVEKTESSLGVLTARRTHIAAKTPCPGSSLRSSPFVIDARSEFNMQTEAEVMSVDKGDAQEDDTAENELWSSPIKGLTSKIPQPKLAIYREAVPVIQETLKPAPLAVKIPNAAVLSSLPRAVNRVSSRPLSKDTAKDVAKHKGPIIKELQVNPMDLHIQQTILTEMQPGLHSYDGFYDCSSQQLNARRDIQKYCRSSKAPTGPALALDSSHFNYRIRSELGAGAFAPVYLADCLAAEDSDQPLFAARPTQVAIKSEHPPSAWEFYMIATAHRRLGISRASESIVKAFECHLYADEVYLVEEYKGHGTLLDLVNACRESPGAGVDESLAMFYTVELLRTVEALHSKQMIHGDLKADNVLVRLPLEDRNELSSQYSAEGTGGWSQRGITLIDFGRGIDMTRFEASVGFIADWPTGPTDCAEMRELRPWTYQADYHGLAAIVHTLLFGKYIDTVMDKTASGVGPGGRTWRLKEPLKRYWKAGLWSDLFSMLLNPVSASASVIESDSSAEASEQYRGEDNQKMPLLKGLRSIRERFEQHLEGTCERGIGLKAMMRKVETTLSSEASRRD